MRGKLIFVVLAGLPIWGSGAHATTTTTTFQTRVTIAATCTIGGATTLDFGSPGLLAANVDLTSTIQVTCTNTTAFNIGLDKGANGASVTHHDSQMYPYSVHSPTPEP